MIVGNLVGQPETGFGSDENDVLLVTQSGMTKVPRAAKREVAERILTEALTLRHAS